MKTGANTSSAMTTDQLIAESETQLEKLRETIAKKEHITRNVNRQFQEQLTFGERIADRVAQFGGSWTFIGLFAAFMLFWVALNTIVLAGDRSFDPYPYILLNLCLSMLAAIQAPVIMMSQNRQASRDRLEAENDYGVNLKAELEILDLREKLDDLRDKKWTDLIEMQQEQIKVLTGLAASK